MQVEPLACRNPDVFNSFYLIGDVIQSYGIMTWRNILNNVVSAGVCHIGIKAILQCDMEIRNGFPLRIGYSAINGPGLGVKV